jgi:hypothetical protein
MVLSCNRIKIMNQESSPKKQLFSLTDLLQNYAQGGRTGYFEVKNEVFTGKICLTVGVITHAEVPDFIGVNAFFEILAWKSNQYQWFEEVFAHPVSMSSHVEDLLVQAIQRDAQDKFSGMRTQILNMEQQGPNGSITRSLKKAVNEFILHIKSHELEPISHVLIGKQLSMGRGTENDIIIPDSSLSRRHVFVYLADDHVFVRDLGSTNGTKINNEPIVQGILRSGDTLTMGEVNCQLEVRTKISSIASF